MTNSEVRDFVEVAGDGTEIRKGAVDQKLLQRQVSQGYEYATGGFKNEGLRTQMAEVES